MFDITNNLEPKIAVNTSTVTSDTTTAGNEIDLKDYQAIDFSLVMGTLTDGDYAVEITESDTSGSGFTAVADSDLIRTEPSFTTDTDDNKIAHVGYRGDKRYVKMTVVSTNTATNGATFTGVAYLEPKVKPSAANAT